MEGGVMVHGDGCGVDLDDLVASRFGKEDDFSMKARFEEMMVDLGVTVQDLKNVGRGVFGNPEDDYYVDDKKEDSIGVPPDVLAAVEYVDPCEKAKRFNMKLDWTDLPCIYPDDPWTIYPEPPISDPCPEEEGAVITRCKRTNDCEIKKKDDDDVPTPDLLGTTGAAAAAAAAAGDKQTDG